MADLTSHRHEILSASEKEIEQRIENYYPDAVATWCAKRQKRRRGRDLFGRRWNHVSGSEEGRFRSSF